MIRVGLLDLSDLVYKPDYADSVPHITLYDGSDREYASALLHLLYKYDFHQEVEVNTLQKLGPKAPTGGNFSLLYDDFYNYHTIITGISPDVAASIPMNSLDKLRCVEAILNDNFEKISDRLTSHAEDVRQAQLPFETDDD
ncbi:hypothetical protein [Methylorubrum extorquens]|uniref:hypothetical protein n=1 Tax=Methylorubrum extorquens TaxID=408 RepID=UPI001FCB8C2B|nr:hypothetical protein [Methylorubrum extorquens]